MNEAIFRCLKNKSSSTKLVVELTRILPFKQSRVRELLAAALNFKSYNALVAQVQDSGIYFKTEGLASSLVQSAKEKYGVDINDREYYAKVSKLLSNMDELGTGLARKIVVADFACNYEPDQPPEETRFLKVEALPEYMLSDFLYDLLGDKLSVEPIDYDAGDVSVFFSQSNPCKDFFRVEVGIAESNILNSGVAVFLSDVYDAYRDEGFDTIRTGFGRIHILVEDSIDEDDTAKLLESGRNNQVVFRAPNGEFMSITLIDARIEQIEFLPKESSIELPDCLDVNHEDMLHSSVGRLPVVSLDDLIREHAASYLKKGRHISARPYSLNQLDGFESHSLSFDVNLASLDDKDFILVNIPSFAEVAVKLGWDCIQKFLKVPRTLLGAIREDEDMRKLDVVLQAGGVEFKAIRLDDWTSIIPRSNSMLDNDVMRQLEANSSYLQASPFEFVQALKKLGVQSISYNELIDHDAGDMIGNCFVAYDLRGEVMFMFEVYALYGYSETYHQLTELFKTLNGGCALKMVYEDDIRVDTYEDIGGDLMYLLEVPDGEPNFSADLNYVLFLTVLEEGQPLGEPKLTADLKEAINAIFKTSSGLGLRHWEVIGPVPIPANTRDITNINDIIRSSMADAVVTGLDRGSLDRLRDVFIRRFFENQGQLHAHSLLILTADSNEDMKEYLQIRNRMGYQSLVKAEPPYQISGAAGMMGEAVLPRDFTKLSEATGLPIQNLVYFDSQRGGVSS